VSTIDQSGTTLSRDQQQLYDAINNSLITGADPTAPAEGAGGEPPTYLTPDALLIYCQTRLQGIDSQVEAAMTQQENINTEQSGIQALLTEIAQDSNAASTSGSMNSKSECETLEQNLENLISQIQAKDPDCSQLGQLEQLHDAIMATGSGPYTVNGQLHGYYGTSTSVPPQADGTTIPTGVAPSNGGPDNIIDQSEFTNFTNTLNNINSSLGSGAEINMIKVQSLMSDRTTAITLTTNILQSYDDGLSKVADNIGK
jgi:hypothetical protein